MANVLPPWPAVTLVTALPLPRRRSSMSHLTSRLSPLLVLLLVGCTGDDPALNKGTVEMAVSPGSIDFGEVVRGTFSEIGVTVSNSGYGHLDFDTVELASSSSADFELVSFPEEGLAHNETGILKVRYTPDAEGQDFGEVDLTTNDDVNELTRVPLSGLGVAPCIDIDPETLYFGQVEPGQSEILTFSLRACGSGDLSIPFIQFAGSEAVAYSFTLPDEFATAPYTLANGFDAEVAVTFTPPSTDPYEGQIQIASNDPEQPLAIVYLEGNVDDPPENATPEVEIEDPNNGASFLDSDLVELHAHVVDDDPMNQLTCGWFMGDGSLVTVGGVGSDGEVSATGYLTAGESPSTSLEVRCTDPAGAVGRDTVSLMVYPADEPVEYTLSGGDSIFDYMGVDDDVTVYLNGTVVYSDTDGHPSSLPPFTFEANPGDEIRIKVIDQNITDTFLDPVVLHFGTDSRQNLTDGFCLSSDPTSPCYDSTYTTNMPNPSFDETFTISIP